MFNTRKAFTRERVREYLIDASMDYASECLEKEPTKQDVQKFVVDDIKRVMGYRMRYGVLSQEMVIDYLQGLSLGVAYTYYDEWQKLNEWTGESNDIQKATDSDMEKANAKYWHLLSAEILRWDRG